MGFWQELKKQSLVCGVVLAVFGVVSHSGPSSDPLLEQIASVLFGWMTMTVWTAAVGHALVLQVLGRGAWLLTWPMTVLALYLHYAVPFLLGGGALSDLADTFLFALVAFCLPWGTLIFVVRGLIELGRLQRMRYRSEQAEAVAWWAAQRRQTESGPGH